MITCFGNFFTCIISPLDFLLGKYRLSFRLQVSGFFLIIIYLLQILVYTTFVALFSSYFSCGRPQWLIALHMRDFFCYAACLLASSMSV